MIRPFHKKKFQLMLFLILLVFNACGEKEVHDISSGVPHVISVIEENKAYRSPQLTGQEFTEAIKRYGFKTIINLRGEKPEKSWYREEKKAVESAGIAHINIRMHPSRFPHRKDLLKLLDTFKTAQRPILIHCKAGADRTGEASAIYQMIYMGKSSGEALNMLAVTYYHDSTILPAKRYFIKNVWQGQQWAYSTYDPCVPDYKYYDQDRYCDQ
jgi:protein tyrosine/serine phosphatase